MKKSKGAKAWSTGRRRILLLAVCVVMASIAAGAIVAHVIATDAEVVNMQSRTKEMEQHADKQLAAIKERKAAEAAEVEKAKQEAEAKELAAQSIAGSTDASQLNSSACNRSTKHNVPSSIDVVVNKKHCLQPLTYAPSDLVTSNGATLSTKAIDAYNQLFAAAAAAGQPFYTTSSYRSYQTQIATYNHWVSVSGAAGADTYSARPGYSEHQTGLAFDVAANGCVLDCFGSTSQYGWLQQNAANYGFIQRYYAGYEAITGYKAEEWHYRYVGTAVAKDMQARGVKTLEEYWNIIGGDY